MRRYVLIISILLGLSLFPALEKGPGEASALTLGQSAKPQSADEARGRWLAGKAALSYGFAHLRVHRAGENLITPAQSGAIVAKLEPGDIIFTRREWYVSNVGIPGWWTHSALYVGGGRVVEALGQGVTLSPFGGVADADALAIVRPNLPRQVRESAAKAALARLGTPYDYDFDFSTDDSLVCTELIYKAYADGQGTPAFSLKVGELAGKPFLSPNDLARWFAEGLGEGARGAELVAFLDGVERDGVALPRGWGEFRLAWARSPVRVLFASGLFDTAPARRP